MVVVVGLLIPKLNELTKMFGIPSTETNLGRFILLSIYKMRG